MPKICLVVKNSNVCTYRTMLLIFPRYTVWCRSRCRSRCRSVSFPVPFPVPLPLPLLDIRATRRRATISKRAECVWKEDRVDCGADCVDPNSTNNEKEVVSIGERTFANAFFEIEADKAEADVEKEKEKDDETKKKTSFVKNVKIAKLRSEWEAHAVDRGPTR